MKRNTTVRRVAGRKAMMPDSFRGDMNMALITYVEYLEMSSGAELRKFKYMPQIVRDDILDCDFTELVRRLQEEQ